METLLISLTFVAGLFIGTVYARARLRPVIDSLEDVHTTALAILDLERKESATWRRIATDRNRVLGQMGQDIERLKLREAEARKILEPLAECDPAVREWLGK